MNELTFCGVRAVGGTCDYRYERGVMTRSHALRALLIILSAWLLSGCHTPIEAKEPEQPPAAAAVKREDATPCEHDWKARDSAWWTFRKRFPYHVQTIALSKPFGAGCRVLIVSEPPPSATLSGLKEATLLDAVELTTPHHKIGLDGWVADAVTILPPMPEEEVASVVSELSRYMFKTAYKAYATPIEAPQEPRKGSVDVRVHPAEIHQWVLQDNIRFTPVMGGEPLKASEVLSPGHAGVYFSSERPIVAWAVPRGNNLHRFAVEARQFALDSDVIFGAVATKDTVLILARERSVSVDELPPVRFETLTLLASVEDGQLAQSYERMHVLSGRFAPGKDWAPIYLSPQLIDTEYGSLLNITDQLLKSWSLLGETTYENFDYPRPLTWPFQKPATQELNVNSLIFNWNTNGLGAVFEMGKYTIVSVRGTASHSVTYAVDDKPTREVQSLENRAYEWFSSVNDPYLTRTVQYTVFYQIAHNLGLRAPSQGPGAPDHGVHVLEEATMELLLKLRSPTGQMARAAANASLSARPWLLDQGKDEHRREVMISVFELETTLKALHDDVLRRLAKILAAPRQFHQSVARIAKAKTPSKEGRAELVLWMISREISRRAHFIQDVVDLGRIKDNYIAANERRPSRWIHTPAVVVSSNHGSLAKAIGGHNIDSSITGFRFTPPQGGAPDLSPRLLASVKLNHGAPPSVSPTPIVPREAPIALRTGELRVDGARGLREMPSKQQMSAGWSSSPKPGAAEGCGAGCISVTKEENAFVLRKDRQTILANNRGSLADAIAHVTRGNKPITIEMVGLSKKESSLVIKSARRSQEANFQAFTQSKLAPGATPDVLSKGKIVSSHTEALPDGTISVVFDVEVEGAREGSSRRGQIRAVVHKLTDHVRKGITRVIEKVLPSKDPVKSPVFERNLRREMRSILKDAGTDVDIEIDFATQFGDIGISRKDRAGDQPGSPG